MLKGYRAWFWLTLLCAALYLPGMVPLPAIDRDESRFMQASRQMVETGDLIRIRFHVTARNKKPAGIHWLQSASVVVFSSTDSIERWPYRVPSVLASFGSVYLMFLLAQFFVRRRTAFLAAALLGSSVLVVVEANIAKTDAVLLATIMLAQYGLARAWFRAREDEPPDWTTPICLWLGLAIGILIKGPIAPATLGFTVLGLKLMDRHTRLWPHLRPLIGVPVALAIAAPWYVAIILLDPTFLAESAGHDFMGKVIGAQEKHGFPPGFYLLAMTLTLGPAALFVWTSLVWSYRARKQPAVLFTLAWLVPYWILLEVLPTKLLHYVLPLYPAVILLVVQAVEASEAGLVRLMRHWLTRAYYLLWLGLMIGAAAVMFWMPMALGDGPVWTLLVTVVGVLVIAPICVRLAWKTNLRASLTLAAVASPLFFAPVLQWGMPAADRIWPSRAAAQMTAASGAGSGTLVGSSGYTEPSFIFYHGTATVFADPAALARRLVAMKDWRAYISPGGREKFIAAMVAQGKAPRKLGTVRGYNYTKGRDVNLTLYGPTGAKMPAK